MIHEVIDDIIEILNNILECNKTNNGNIFINKFKIINVDYNISTDYISFFHNNLSAICIYDIQSILFKHFNPFNFIHLSSI